MSFELECEKNENNQKEAGMGPFKKSMSKEKHDVYDEGRKEQLRRGAERKETMITLRVTQMCKH